MWKRKLVFLVAAWLITGCGRGKVTTPPASQQAPSTRPEAVAHFVIAVPAVPTGGLKGKYVSYATRSVTIGLTGSTTATRTIDVNSAQAAYTLAIKAFAGSNTFTVNLYDNIHGTGNLLSTAQVTTTLAVNAPNTVNVTTAGVPASIQLQMDNPAPFKGIAANYQLAVVAVDAGGSTIVGTYAQPINLTNSDTTGAVVLGSSLVTTSGSVMVTYNGANIGAVTLGATSSGVASGNITSATITPVLRVNGGVVTTLAGQAAAGLLDGTGTGARFAGPGGVVVDGSGNIYVADYNASAIRKVTAAGVVTTIGGDGTAGFADGIGTGALFNLPFGMSIGTAGNVFVADTVNNRIREITPADVISTIAGQTPIGTANGTGSQAQFYWPNGLVVDGTGDIYVADTSNNLIRLVTPGGVVTTFAGQTTPGTADGTGTNAQFKCPTGIAIDGTGNLYIADYSNNIIRRMTTAGVVTTFAGQTASGTTNGTVASAQFNGPIGMAIDSDGNIFIADTLNNMIRKISAAGVVTTLAGQVGSGSADGTGTTARFNCPNGITVDAAGVLYVGDYNNYVIRKIE